MEVWGAEIGPAATGPAGSASTALCITFDLIQYFDFVHKREGQTDEQIQMTTSVCKCTTKFTLEVT